MDNRERITIDLLNWVATQEVAAAGADRDKLWALGSKLMALREGLTPASSEALQRELRAATEAATTASRAAGSSEPEPSGRPVLTCPP